MVIDHILAYELGVAEDDEEIFPAIGVQVKEEPRKSRRLGIIDSGFSQTFIPRQLIHALDLRGESYLDLAGGPGGGFNVICIEAELEFSSPAGPLAVWKGIINIPLQDVIDKPIIGRDSLFSIFDITFSERTSRVILST